VKAQTKEKKEKENVLKNLELVNLKNVFLQQFKELRRKTTKIEKEKLLEEHKEYLKNLQHLQA
jgi:cell division protein FtsX